MAAAGWFNDESDPTLARWHDGEDWTEHVVVKARWEAAGHPPPPPEELFWVPPTLSRTGRARALLGSAVVVAVLVVAGIALADGDGDPAADDTSSITASTRRGGASVGAGDLDVDRDPSAAEDELTDPSGGDAADAGGSGAPSGTTGGAGTTRTTARAPSTGGVQRTERATQTQSNPGPVTNESNSQDQTDVGNTTRTSIHLGYDPPATTPTSAAPPSPDPTTAPPDPGPSNDL